MTESDAFLAAIADRPDDDLPRLVYADWLDEHGQPERAEFIRVQIELAKLPADDMRRDELREREKALLEQYRDEWRLQQFHFPGVHQQFRHGFVEHVQATGGWLLDHPAALPSAPLVRSLKVTNAASAGMGLVDLPGLEQIVHLDLTNTFHGLKFDIPAFLTDARLNRLRALTLGTCGLWPWAMAPLVEVERLRQLDRLDLWGNPFRDDGARMIADCPNLTNLTELDLSAHEQQTIDCVSDEGAAALAASPALPRLRDLDLSGHAISNAGLSSLVRSPNFDRLERLAVAKNKIGGTDDEVNDSGIEALVASPELSNLRELVLAKNRLSPLGAEALAAWPHLERMRVVDLRECELSSVTRERLLRSPWADRFIL